MIHGLTSNFSTVLPITLNNLQNYFFTYVSYVLIACHLLLQKTIVWKPQTNRTKIGSKLLKCYVCTYKLYVWGIAFYAFFLDFRAQSSRKWVRGFYDYTKKSIQFGIYLLKVVLLSYLMMSWKLDKLLWNCPRAKPANTCVFYFFLKTLQAS